MRIGWLALALAALAACSPGHPWRDVTGNGRSDREAEAANKGCYVLAFPGGASGLSEEQIDQGEKTIFACMAAEGWAAN